MLKQTACLLILLFIVPAKLQAENQSASIPDVLRAYADLLSMRTEKSELLAGAEGIMVLEAGADCSLKPLDIIIKYYNQPIQSVDQLFELISQHSSQKETIGLTILRGGAPNKIQLAAGSLGVVVSDMSAADVSNLMGGTSQETGALASSGKPMTEYLKGRPYRTPNNRQLSDNN